MFVADLLLNQTISLSDFPDVDRRLDFMHRPVEPLEAGRVVLMRDVLARHRVNAATGEGWVVIQLSRLRVKAQLTESYFQLDFQWDSTALLRLHLFPSTLRTTIHS